MEFFGLLIFLFLVYIRPQDFVPGLLGARLVFVAMALTIFYWIMTEVQRRTTKLFNLTQDFWLFGLAVAVLISTFKINWLSYTLNTLVEMSKLLAFYFMVSFIIDSEKRLEVFVKFLVFFTMAVCFVAALQPFGIDIFKVGMSEDRIQGVGIFQNPNYLAYSAIFALPFAYNLLVRSQGFANRMLGFSALSVLVWAIFLTKSRGGFICFVLTMLFTIGQTRGRVFRLLVNLFSVLIILLAVTNGFGRMGTLLNMQQDSAIMDRVEAWYVAIQLFKESPLTGIGYGRFEEYSRKAAHSSFVQIGVENGVIGLFLWVGFLYFLLKRTKWLVSHSSLSKTYFLSLEGTLFAYLVTSFLATMGLRITLFIIGGLVAAAERMELKKENLKREEKMVLTSSGFFQPREIRNILAATVGVVYLWHLLIKAIG